LSRADMESASPMRQSLQAAAEREFVEPEELSAFTLQISQGENHGTRSSDSGQ